MRKCNIAVDLDSPGFFGDFLMNQPIIDSVLVQEGNGDLKVIEAFDKLDTEEKEELVRKFVQENIEVFQIAF